MNNAVAARRIENAIAYWLGMKPHRHDAGGQRLIDATLADLRWRLTQA